MPGSALPFGRHGNDGTSCVAAEVVFRIAGHQLSQYAVVRHAHDDHRRVSVACRLPERLADLPHGEVGVVLDSSVA